MIALFETAVSVTLGGDDYTVFARGRVDVACGQAEVIGDIAIRLDVPEAQWRPCAAFALGRGDEDRIADALCEAAFDEEVA